MDTQPARTFTLASRASPLAKIQTYHTLDLLRSAFPTNDFKTEFISTGGDKDKVQALYVLGGKSLWTKELEVALLEKAVDIVVHCLKDVPTVMPEGCKIGAILKREDPVDALVVKKGKEWKTLDDLPEGSVVGSSSIRRVSQLRRNYPKLVFQDCSSSAATCKTLILKHTLISSIDSDSRLAKLDDPEGPYAALVLAKAGLVRLGRGDRVTSDLTSPTLFWAVGQGALAIEIREDDAEAQRLCDSLTHWETQYACLAERGFLRVLEGGCTVPVGVETFVTTANEQAKEGVLKLTGTVTAIGGEKHVQHTLLETVGSPEAAEAVGAALAKILIQNGADAILEEVRVDRAARQGEAKTAEEVKKIEGSMAATA